MRRAFVSAAWVLLLSSVASAQDMEPKAYSASPKGATFLVLGYSWSTGGVVFDPSLPVSDVQADVNGAILATGHTFDLFSKLALVTVAVPYGWGTISGKVNEAAREITRSGLADARAKLSVNLVGNPAMTPREFAKAPRRTIVGASLTVSAPTGQYDDAKLINLGTNRWSFKPEVGVSVPLRRWDLDAYLGAWFFTDNPSFYPGGRRRTQDPIVALQAHASYTIRPRLWIAGDTTWYAGGRARVEGGAASEKLNNSRAGLTLSFPLGRMQSFKIAYSRGVAVRTGTDFSTVAVGWQKLWL